MPEVDDYSIDKDPEEVSLEELYLFRHSQTILLVRPA